jgi:hypothetical protein
MSQVRGVWCELSRLIAKLVTRCGRGSPELEAAREWHRLGEEGEAVLGTGGWSLFRSFGRIMSGAYSGRYVSALPREEVLALLEALRRGERIPIHLMHRHRTGHYEASCLSLDEGRLMMHYVDRSEPA